MKRAVSSMISPMASRTNTELREARHHQNTPSESMRELRLEVSGVHVTVVVSIVHVHGQDVGVEATKVSPAASVSSIPSREVSPGSYQGNKVSPYGLPRRDSVSSFCLGQAQFSKEMKSIVEQEQENTVSW